jgi:hypothetical protein
VLAASIIRAIALMLEAANASETSVNFYQTTRRNNPEDSHLQSKVFITALHTALGLNCMCHYSWFTFLPKYRPLHEAVNIVKL